MEKKIILFELNEVPFRVLDEFCRWRPTSALARHLPICRQYETYAEDHGELSPWKTWPSFHRGVNNEKHHIDDFGQNLSEVDQEYPTIWQLLTAEGVETGVFGSLHTYPVPRNLDHYSFFFPDTFAAGSECFPDKLSVFQDFNLQMARESARNVSRKLPWSPALRLLAGAPALGLKLTTFGDLGGQLLAERLERSRKVRRRTYQTVLAFDVFMGQLISTKPAFTTFFTNHVASSMHRYWAATFPQDYEEFGYDDGWVSTYKNEIDFAMRKFDQFFARLAGFVDQNPDYMLWVATSMGQAATTTVPVTTELNVTDLNRFMQAMGMCERDWSPQPAMVPQVNVTIAKDKVNVFREALNSLTVNDTKVIYRDSRHGFFSIEIGQRNLDTDGLRLRLRGRRVSLDELGMTNVDVEDKTGSNAYHIPQGSLLVYDPCDLAPKAERTQISALELAPTILSNYSVPIPAYMRPPTRIAA